MDSQFAGSGVLLELDYTTVYREEKELGKGRLTVEESALRWESEDKADSIALDYPNISVHAISRDTSSFPHQCVLLLHCTIKEVDAEEDNEETTSDNDDATEVIEEIRLVPSSADDLEKIFAAISECQTLYPDPDDSDSEEEEEEEEEEGLEEIDEVETGFYTSSEEGLPHLTTEGQAVLAHLESVFQVVSPEEFAGMVEEGSNGYTEGQFDDAD